MKTHTMSRIINLTLTPKQAADAKYYTSQAARELHVREQNIALLRIVKRSVDARRGALKVNLSLEAFIDDEPQPAPLRFDYPSVEGKREAVVIGAGPAGLFAALRLIESGVKPIIFERGKEVVERGKDIARIQRNQGIDPDSNQQSNTSGTRRSGDFPVGEGISTLSMKCLCRSVTFTPASFSSSAALPTTITSPSSLRQIGSGVPQ